MPEEEVHQEIQSENPIPITHDYHLNRHQTAALTLFLTAVTLLMILPRFI